MVKLIKPVIVFFIFLGVWQLLVTVFALPFYILPTPLSIFIATYDHASLIGKNIVPTLYETFIGFTLGALLGSFTALCIHYCKPLRTWILPLLLVSQALPTFALAPLLILWLGYGVTSKIITTIIMIFFPITSAFYDGLKRTPLDYLDIAHTLSRSRLRILWYIEVRSALPHLASGLRVAATFAPMGAVIGEWVGSSQGLGYLMLSANAHMNISLMFAALFALVLMTVIFYYSVDRLLKYIISWEPVS